MLLLVSTTGSGCILTANPPTAGSDGGSNRQEDTEPMPSPDVGDTGEDTARDGTEMPEDTDDGSDGGDAEGGPTGFRVQGGLAPSGGRSTGESNGGAFEVRGRFLKQGEGHRARDPESSGGFSVELHPLYMRP
jgi:hypothetical protein